MRFIKRPVFIYSITVLMGVCVAIFIYALLTGKIEHTYQANMQDWITYSPPSNDFSILLPSTPKIDMITQNPRDMHYTSSTDDGVMYSVSVSQNIENLPFTSERFEIVKQNIENVYRLSGNKRLVEINEVSQGLAKGVEYISTVDIEDQTISVHTHVYFVGNTIYSLIRVSPPGTESDNRFFESFSITSGT